MPVVVMVVLEQVLLLLIWEEPIQELLTQVVVEEVQTTPQVEMVVQDCSCHIRLLNKTPCEGSALYVLIGASTKVGVPFYAK